MTEKLIAWFLLYNGKWKNERTMNYIGCPESNVPFVVVVVVVVVPPPLAINKAMNVIF